MEHALACHLENLHRFRHDQLTVKAFIGCEAGLTMNRISFIQALDGKRLAFYDPVIGEGILPGSYWALPVMIVPFAAAKATKSTTPVLSLAGMSPNNRLRSFINMKRLCFLLALPDNAIPLLPVILHAFALSVSPAFLLIRFHVRGRLTLTYGYLVVKDPGVTFVCSPRLYQWLA